MLILVKYRAGTQGAGILKAGEYREYRAADSKSWKAQDILYEEC
jgi:hypothetical protein